MKKALTALAAAAAVGLASCGRYSSSYNAVGFVHNELSDSAFMDFYRFEGRIVFDLDGDEGDSLEYSGRLEKGSITVSIDRDGTKQELFRLSDGGEVSSSLALPEKDKVYIIAETDGSCENGRIDIEIR